MSETPAGPRKRSVARRVVLACVAIVVGIATLEGASSLLLTTYDFASAQAPKAVRTHTMYDTLLGWVNRPNFSSANEYGPGIGITTNALGYRGTPGVNPADTTKTRLVCSGDSFTLGYGVSDEHTWCALLQSHFPGLETLNMGQAAYGLDQAYLWYRRDGDRVRHQVHVFAMIEIEFERATSPSHRGRFKPMFVLENGKLRTTNVPVPVQTTEALNRSYAMRSLEDLRLTQTLRKVSAFDGTQLVEKAVDDHWPVYEALFTELSDYDKRRGVDLVVVYVPVRADATPGPQDARRAKLAAFAKAHGIRFLDFTPELRAMAMDSLDRLYITRVAADVAPGIPGHYSNLGNAWFAHLLAAHLDSLPPLAKVRKPRR